MPLKKIVKNEPRAGDVYELRLSPTAVKQTPIEQRNLKKIKIEKKRKVP